MGTQFWLKLCFGFMTQTNDIKQAAAPPPPSSSSSAGLDSTVMMMTDNNNNTGSAAAAPSSSQAAAAHELKPNQTLSSGRYRVIKELNRGGTAVVYEAVDVSNNNLSVALKVMNTREGVMQMPVKAVKREIELASQMRDAMAAAAAGKNPNVSAALAKEMQLGQRHIVQLLDVFAHEGRSLVIVWE